MVHHHNPPVGWHILVYLQNPAEDADTCSSSNKKACRKAGRKAQIREFLGGNILNLRRQT